MDRLRIPRQSDELSASPEEVVVNTRTGWKLFVIASVFVVLFFILIGLRWLHGSSSVIVSQESDRDQQESDQDGASVSASTGNTPNDDWQAYPEQYYSNANFSGADRAKILSYTGKEGVSISIHVKDDADHPIPQALCELYTSSDSGRHFLLRRPTNAEGVCSFLDFPPTVSYQVNVFTYRGPATSLVFQSGPKQTADRTVTLRNTRLVAAAAGCIDPNGEDIYTPGSVQFDGKTYPDSCSSGARITEMYCYEKSDEPGSFVVGQEDFDCPDGCGDFACNP